MTGDWVYVGRFPGDRHRQYLSVGVAHLCMGLAVACMVEDFGLVRPAGELTPRCAVCVRWLAGR